MAKFCLKEKFNELVVFIVIMVSSLTTSAQLNPAVGTGPWKYVNPYQHGFSFNDMSFIDNKTGLAVGGNGAIARTVDSGRNWQYIPFKFVNATKNVALASLNDVQFVSPSVAYAVGNSGLMIKSTDGGLNWSTINTPLTPFNRSINALHFINKDTGYIGGAAINTTNTTSINDAPKVYFTRNGGTTWDSLVSPYRKRQYNTALPTPNPVMSGFNTTDIQRIVFVNDSVGYACGSANANRDLSAVLWKIEKGVITDYSLHRTKFGVSSYTVNHTASTQTFKGLVAINDSLVLISSNSNGSIVRVKTGKNDSTANAIPAIYGAYEKGAYEVVAQVNSFPPYPANSPLSTGAMWHMKKAPGGKIVLSNGNSVAFSTDNGTSWTTTKPTPSTSNIAHWQFYAMDVTPNGRIIVEGPNGLTYDSLPGAPGWSTVYKNIKPLFFSYSAMDWADYCNGVLVGANGTISKTSDGGKTWVDNSNPVFEAAQISLSNVFYPAINNMFFSTFNSIYKSADQGTTNDVIFTEPNPNGQLNAFEMVGQDRAWAVGYRFSPAVQRTLIYRSLNANAVAPVWDTVKTFPLGTFAPQLRNIKFANKDTGYACGSRSKVYRTVDGGSSWTDISFDTLAPNNNINYTALSVINGKTLYVGGSSKKLYRSTDAGVTWTNLTLVETTNPITISAFSSISVILMNDVNNGYINTGAFLLKTTDGWATWTYDISPQSFSNISLYPKTPAPIENKKLFGMPLIFGFPGPISTQSAALIEYGNASLTTLSTTETVVNATCTNLTAGSITVTATGGILPYTYSVNGGAYQTSNVLTGLTQGAKTVSIKDGSCQTVTKTVTVGFTDNLSLTTNNDTTVCAGAPVQMIATSAATTYAWTPAAGLSNAAISNPIATVNSNTAYTVTASLNTCVKTRTVNIGIRPNPIINAGPDKIIVTGDIITLQGSGSNASTISWSPATSIVSNGNTFTPTVNPFVSTIYRLTVKDFNNCTSTDDVSITVIPYCIKVMDAFTPNNDGINDKWLVTNGAACTKKTTVNVFNRYGTSVYKNDAYQNNWDGTYSGKAIPDGTYYYVITYQLINGNALTLKGNVTIIR